MAAARPPSLTSRVSGAAGGIVSSFLPWGYGMSFMLYLVAIADRTSLSFWVRQHPLFLFRLKLTLRKRALPNYGSSTSFKRGACLVDLVMQ
jgi:hypothetical protein